MNKLYSECAVEQLLHDCAIIIIKSFVSVTIRYIHATLQKADLEHRT